MFPLRWNFPFRKKDGSLVNIGDAMGGDYTLPTASASTKGGIKVGSGLTMSGEKLNVDIEPELPDYGVEEAGKVLKVSDDGSLEWDTDGGAGGVYLEDYYTKTESGTSFTYSKSFTITEAGTYLIRVCSYVNTIAVKINNVVQSRDFEVSADYLYWYNIEQSLSVDDVISIEGSGSGKGGVSTVIVKTS